MLSSQQALADLDFEQGLILPDRLRRPAHAHYLAVAEQRLKTYADSLEPQVRLAAFGGIL